jgi:tetratricopeptide (TPR) repeat protein
MHAFLLIAALLQTPEPDAKQLTEQGLAHYNVGEYDKAIDEFKRAYLLSKTPVLLFNIAQAQRLKGDCKEALQSYKAYLRADPSAQRAKIDARIAEMEKCVKEKPEVAPPPPQTQTQTPPQTQTQTQTQTLTLTPTPTPTPTPAPVERTPPSKVPPLLLGAGGLVVAGVGTALLISVSGDVNDLQNSCSPHCDPKTWDGLPGRADIAYVLIGVGGAAVVGSVVWYYLRGRSEESSYSRTWIAPSPNGFVVGGAF